MGRPRQEIFNYDQLVGNAKKIVDRIYDDCIRTRSLETNFIVKTEFCEKVQIKEGSVRNTCNRLKTKKVLDFIAQRGPKAGWKFILSQHIYDQICMLNTDTNTDTISFSSSSVVVNDTPNSLSLPESWKKINYSSLKKILLEKYKESFGLRQLNSIFRNSGSKLSADEVQESINNFVMALSESPNNPLFQRKVKIAVLLDVLYEGEVFNWKSTNESLSDLEKEKYNAAKRKIHFETKFNEYKSKLTEDQILATVPDVFKKTNHLWAFAESSNDTAMLLNLAEEHVVQHFRRDHYEGMEEHEN